MKAAQGLPMTGSRPRSPAMLGEMLELAMILRRRRFARARSSSRFPKSRSNSAIRGRSPAHTWPSTTRATRSSRSSCWRPTRPSPAALTEKNIGFLRRAHPDPEPFKLDEFAEFARSLGLKIDQPQSRFELQRSLERNDRQARGIRCPLRTASQPETGQAIRPSPRDTMPWPARITATSHRRYDAIPTCRCIGS